MCAGTLCSTQPPSGTSFASPFDVMLCTMKPTSSIWASSRTTGLPPSGAKGAYTFCMASRCEAQGKAACTASATSPSKPEGPKAFVRVSQSFKSICKLQLLIMIDRGKRPLILRAVWQRPIGQRELQYNSSSHILPFPTETLHIRHREGLLLQGQW